jgi:biotin transport system substrate-specific component
MERRKQPVFSLILVAMFASLTAIGAFIKIPTPVVPLTLQIMFVFLAGCLLGSKQGGLSQLVYVGVGLVGFPVFTGGGGLTYIFKPTFGYLVGFIIAAYVIGKLVEGKKTPSFKDFFIANMIGLAFVYICGIIYLYISLNIWIAQPTSLWAVLVMGFFTSIPADVLLGIGASIAAVRLYRLFERRKMVSA